MRFSTNWLAVLGAACVAAVSVSAGAAPAERPYCPDAAHAAPAKVPADLSAAVARAFQMDESAMRGGAYVRCAGPKLLACYVGANLHCFKADTRRALPGASAWCRANRGSLVIPMSATGHATIYDWSCDGDRAVAGKVLMPVDARGYIAGNWKEIR